MVGGLTTATLLLVHETAQRLSLPRSCQLSSNVRVQELGDGGIAALHARRLLEGMGTWTKELSQTSQSKLKRLFELAPDILSEFKPSWGWVFETYLYDFSHWTYTDTDIVFGRLDDWLENVGFGDYDIETWSFNGDAGRLFLRGQWAMHKNLKSINLLWRYCSHLGSGMLDNIDHKLEFYESIARSRDRRKIMQLERLRTDAHRGHTGKVNIAASHLDKLGHGECGGSTGKFVSAEGCYSCVVFSSNTAAALNLRVKVSPLILSDHVDWPVWWYGGRLLRCLPRGNLSINRCINTLNTWLINDQGTLLSEESDLPSPVDNIYKRVTVIRDCSNMHWICRSAPRAALQVLRADSGRNYSKESLQVTDEIQVRPQVGHGNLPIATLVLTPSAIAYDEPLLVEAPIFHFRKWIDYGEWNAILNNQVDYRLVPFVLEPSGFRKHVIQPSTEQRLHPSSGLRGVGSVARASDTRTPSWME